MRQYPRSRTGLVIGCTVLLTCLLGAFAMAMPQMMQGAKPASKAKYVGSTACAGCHADAAKVHDKGPHAGLVEPLPESMRGCESCHGPGSEHVAGDKTAIQNPAKMATIDAERVCLNCHGSRAGNAAPPKAPKVPEQTWMRGAHPRKNVGCVSCHSEHKGKEKLLKMEPAQLCFGCHANKMPKEGEFEHAAVQKDNCLDCHNPHGTGRPGLVKTTTDAKCAECHDVKDAAFGKAHAETVGVGTRCTSCHSPHFKDKATHGLPPAAHKPFGDRNCTICHAPTPDKPAALKAPVNELCVRCHPAVKGDAATTTHPPVKQQLCTTCHTPHASRAASPPLFKARTEFVCLSCHSKVDTARSSKYRHAPVEQGNCLSCHNGHKSTEEALLTKPAMDLCQGCHPQQRRFTHPVGTKADGNRQVPIIDPRNKKMLTCASCHDVHGGPHEYISQADWRRDLCVQCHKSGLSN